ncbi:hypothetical protein SAMN02910413_1130 [Pseudobutyrivibrio sp. C4]|uniref:hypothetical protein n=1 Tax=Pseudobutyrivibrio sp. C4 TaxID=1520803 RepID=UPI0008B781FC|nr:hypothetical protein [Pseudobutyrivibrio sp. C4]SES88985.1 hypothetical protein SAMN02910413_1130 [Pseudobutyrivibrio sp. C4]
MPKEYQINGVTYYFSKDKFQEIVKKLIKDKRSAGVKYNSSDCYGDLADALNSSEETIRKWYSKGGPSPVDIALVEAISEYAGLTSVTELLEKKESHTMNVENTNNTDRELVKTIYNQMLCFAEKLAYGYFNKTVQLGDGTSHVCWDRDTIFNALIQLHMQIDRASMDIKSQTANKLHDIILTYTENVMCHDVSAKWDALCNCDYLMARRVLVDTYNYGTSDEDDEEYGLKEYIKRIYPSIYDDEEDYLEIPFTYQFIYMREFAIALNNVFRNDFPEYFLFE